MTCVIYLPFAYNRAQRFNIPVISGEMSINERHRHYEQFRKGELKRLVLTSVGEGGVDLSEVNVAMEVAGLYGSRMKASQRFGRILRPKEGKEDVFLALTFIMLPCKPYLSL